MRGYPDYTPDKPPAPRTQEVTVGQKWYAKLKGATACLTCIVTDLSAKTVEISSPSSFSRIRYLRTDIEFIELLEDHDPRTATPP